MNGCDSPFSITFSRNLEDYFLKYNFIETLFIDLKKTSVMDHFFFNLLKLPVDVKDKLERESHF